MRAGFVALGFASLVVLAPATARAHFYVDFPDSGAHSGPSPQPWWQQDSLGSPQKLGPCGDEDDATQGGGGPTGAVTPYAPGQTITLQWTEIISHAGWFRIALAADRSQFVDPPVQVDSNGNSADAGIEDPPVAPVIADGVYQHPIGALKTWPPYAITLPTTPCAKCTIQIIQVMLDHPSNLGNLPDGAPNPDGFLYHHCIDISIGATDGGGGSGSGGGGTSPDAGAGSSGTGGGSGSGGGGNGEAPASSSSGCGCTTGAVPAAGGLLSLLGLAALVQRRRARRQVR
ncbi:MAG TPA: SCE4755 family polysaccharide monooxygenase-like protein [Polyangiaceae bacterium]|jgi:MYXO-CTERM domain-containing protein